MTVDGKADRRASPRWRTPGSAIRLVSARLVPGREVRLLVISRCGALIESTNHLRPGALVEAHLTGSGTRIAVKATIARCWVSAVSRTTGVRYRAALRFEGHIELPGEPAATDG